MSATAPRQTADERRDRGARRRDERVREEGAPRSLDRRHRPGGRHLAALPVPALRHEEGALPRHVPAHDRRTSTTCSPMRHAARPGWTPSTRWAKPTNTVMADRDRLMLMLKCWASCDDPEICEAVRGAWRDLVDLAERASGESPEVVSTFFSKGALLTDPDGDGGIQPARALVGPPDRGLPVRPDRLESRPLFLPF